MNSQQWIWIRYYTGRNLILHIASQQLAWWLELCKRSKSLLSRHPLQLMTKTSYFLFSMTQLIHSVEVYLMLECLWPLKPRSQKTEISVDISWILAGVAIYACVHILYHRAKLPSYSFLCYIIMFHCVICYVPPLTSNPVFWMIYLCSWNYFLFIYKTSIFSSYQNYFCFQCFLYTSLFLFQTNKHVSSTSTNAPNWSSSSPSFNKFDFLGTNSCHSYSFLKL